jgi:hypothetical protein
LYDSVEDNHVFCCYSQDIYIRLIVSRRAYVNVVVKDVKLLHLLDVCDYFLPQSTENERKM